MKTKKLMMMFAVVMSVFALAGLAFAANNVGVNVTSEPIHYHATSDKGGGFTLTFDEGTTLVEGDQITIDLSFGVTLAKDIDIEISPNGSKTLWESDVEIPQSGAPLVESSDGVVTAGADGVYFHIYGTAGTQRITIDVLGDGDPATDNSLEVTDLTADADTLKLYFLDQTTNADYDTGGIYIDDDGDDVYDVDATVGDNTLCINVSQYDGNTVLASFDSKGDKFTFVPSNPEVAHVVSALNIAFDPCKGQEPGYIEIGDRVTQGTDTCDYFDNETGGGFCSLTHVANKMIISSSAPFDQGQYQVKLEILVNGQTGDNGVYWSNEHVTADGYDTKDDACDADVDTTVDLGAPDYELANGDTATPDAPNSDDCDVDSDARAVVLTTPVTNLSLDPSNDYLWIDLPAFNYDLDEINEGDVVSVKVTIIKVPCGTVFEDTWQIGTFGCPAAGVSNMLLYPYFTQMIGGVYWNGIAIVNLSSSDGTATITVYEADGDVGTVDVPVKANSMYVGLLSDLVSQLTQTSGSGSLGDSRCYIIVSTDFNADGFAMMANSATGESMGYLPRTGD